MPTKRARSRRRVAVGARPSRPAPPRPPASRRRDIYVLASLLGAAIVCYANSIHNPFIWDQEASIVGSPLIRSLANIPLVFKYDLFGNPLGAAGFYRPVGVISSMLDYYFWGLNPVGFHLTCIFLHFLAAVLLFYLFKKLCIPLTVNVLVCLFFVIHPVNTETVTYMVREESLAVIFSVGCFLAYLKVREGSPVFIFPAIGLFLLALLTKESVVMLPFILIVESAFFGRSQIADERHLRRSRWLIAGLLAVSVGYVALRLGFLSSSTTAALSTIHDATPWQRVLTLPRILLTYIGLVAFPRHLHMEYLFVTERFSDPWVWLGVPFLVGLAAALFVHLRRLPETDKAYRNQMVLFLSWFLLGLAPFSQVLVPLHATLAEHWVYFAGIGLMGLLIGLGDFLYRHFPNRSVQALLMVLIVALGVYDVTTTIVRNRDWSGDLRLYLHDMQLEPRSFLLHNNIGDVYYKQGKLEDAKREFLQAIEVSGNRYDVAYNNVGVVYEDEGRDDLAEAAFRKSLEAGAGYEFAYSNLSEVYLRHGRVAEASAVIGEGLRLSAGHRAALRPRIRVPRAKTVRSG